MLGNCCDFAQFSELGSRISLQPRLFGGARSLALTVLRQNSLLTGIIQGICGILLSKIALLLSKVHILREKQPQLVVNRNRELIKAIRDFNPRIRDLLQEGFTSLRRDWREAKTLALLSPA